MKKITTHIEQVKRYIEQQNRKDPAERHFENIDQDLMKEIHALLESLAVAVEDDRAPDLADDTLMERGKFLRKVAGELFPGPNQVIGKRKFNKVADRIFEMGELAGIASELERPIEVVVVLEGGTFSDCRASRDLTLHKVDIDDQSDDPVIYSKASPQLIGLYKADRFIQEIRNQYEHRTNGQ